MMIARRIVLLGVAMMALSVAGLPRLAHAAKPADPLHGDWQLVVEKSTFRPGPGPKGQLRSYRMNGDTEKLTARGVSAEKKPTLVQYEAKYDGKDYPITGSTGGDKISLKRIDALTTESTQKRDGKAAITTRRAVSPDGKTLTVTATGIAPDGQTLDSILIFERRH
jgi:hypothetical protein